MIRLRKDEAGRAIANQITPGSVSKATLGKFGRRWAVDESLRTACTLREYRSLDGRHSHIGSEMNFIDQAASLLQLCIGA